MSPEQREAEQEDGSESQEKGEESPIACSDNIHLYDNQSIPGPGQRRHTHRRMERQVARDRQINTKTESGTCRP